MWQEKAPIPDANRQYFFSAYSILLNYIPDQVKQGLLDPSKKSLIAPTDTRFRGDQRYFEEGQIPEAEAEKLRLEVKQRKRRKDMAEAKEIH